MDTFSLWILRPLRERATHKRKEKKKKKNDRGGGYCKNVGVGYIRVLPLLL